jgi:hypothetical protein
MRLFIVKKVASARQFATAVLVLGVAAAGACNSSPLPSTGSPTQEADAGPPLFRDVTAESGVQADYRNGEEAGLYAILETLGGGVALFDYDGDGLLDLFVTGGGYFEGQEIRGHPSKLYRNLGGFQFKDVTTAVGLTGPIFYTHGCAIADYDRDGWPDLLITGYGRLALYHNEADGKGGRHFVEVTHRAGLDDELWSTSAAWADLDGDGFPDLYVCHYADWSLTKNHPSCKGFDGKTRDICPPARFAAQPHRLYRNKGDGTFADVSKAARLCLGPPQGDPGKGLGVVVVDVDGDGRPDLYVANDMTDRFLYLNRSKLGTILLKEAGMSSGVARDHLGHPNGSMGVAIADYDDCGRPSLWVTNYEHEFHGLYHNETQDGRVFFRSTTQTSGIAALGQSYVGWGTGFFDLDHDGREHLFITNGHPNYYPAAGARRAQLPALLRNVGDGRFEIITTQGGSYFQEEHNGRGVAFGDLANDGRTSIVISHLNSSVVLLRNEAPTRGHWLGISLVGRKHRDIAGARLTLDVAGRHLTRYAQGGGSYLSSSDKRVIFGLGPAEQVGRLRVAWPWGKEESWDGLAIDRYWRLEEGSGSP